MSLLSHRRALRKTPLALVALCAFLSSFLVGAFVHTDDGCEFERHCPSCIVALHHGDGARVAVVALPASCPTFLAVLSTPGKLTGETRLHASRGPPSA